MTLTRTELDEERWASCGPTALAALLRTPLASLHRVFPQHTEKNTWTNWAAMEEALAQLGRAATPTGYAGTTWPAGVQPAPERLWPKWGMVQIQFRGAWDKMSIAHPAQLSRSHWIAVAPLLNATGAELGGKPDPMVFDVNMLDADINHGWVPLSYWGERVAPWLWKGFQPKAKRPGAWSLPEGARSWWVRGALEVTRG